MGRDVAHVLGRESLNEFVRIIVCPRPFETKVNGGKCNKRISQGRDTVYK